MVTMLWLVNRYIYLDTYDWYIWYKLRLLRIHVQFLVIKIHAMEIMVIVLYKFATTIFYLVIFPVCWTSCILGFNEEVANRLFFKHFSIRILSVLRGHSVFSSPPQRPMTSKFDGFLYQILSITFFNYLNSWEGASIFPFLLLSAKQLGTTGTIFITSLVWRGPWLGIEPGTSRTRCQHSIARLSRRRC